MGAINRVSGERMRVAWWPRKWHLIASLTIGLLTFLGQTAVFELRSNYLATAEVDIGGFSISNASSAAAFNLIEPLSRILSFYEKDGGDILGSGVVSRCTVADGLRGSDITNGSYRDLYFISISCRNDTEAAARADAAAMAEILVTRHQGLFAIADRAHNVSIDYTAQRLDDAEATSDAIETLREENNSENLYWKFAIQQEILELEQSEAVLAANRHVVNTGRSKEIIVISRGKSVSRTLGLLAVSVISSFVILLLLMWGTALRRGTRAIEL